MAKSTPAPDPADDRRVEYLPLDELRAAPRNPKAHDVAGIGSSMGRHGVVELPTIDERTGRLVAGHGRVETLTERHTAGQAPPRGVRLADDGRWLVPVLRGWSSTDDDAAEHYLLASNQLTIAPGWTEDLDAMLADLSQRVDVTDLGWSPAELAEITRGALSTADTVPADTTPTAVDDDEEPTRVVLNPTCQLGDLWLLGPHRLKVGDAFVPADLAHLLGGRDRVDAITMDPPFAIYGSSTGIAGDIADDKMVRPFFAQLGRVVAGTVKMFGHVYTCCDWRSYATVWDGFKAAGLDPKNCLVWDKGGGGLGSMYANGHEFVSFFTLLPPSKAMTSGNRVGQRMVYRSNIWRGNRPTGAERLHNAAKPIPLFVDLMTASTDEGETVLDLFGGSGCTVIAAEQCGRLSFTMELNPANADLIVWRYQRDTGTLPVLVSRIPAGPDSTGPVDLAEPEPFNFHDVGG